MLGSRATMAENCGSLPNDVVQDILLRLPVKSVARFRCVSKFWLSITTDPSFLRAQARRASNSLLIHAKKYNFGDPEVGRINLHIWAPATAGGHGMASGILPARRRSSKDVVFASYDGLVCLRDNFREEFEMQENVPCYYVLNPLTGAQIDVPKPSCSEGHLMGLYFYPSTGDYRLIRRLNISGFDKVELLSLGTESWRLIEASPPALTVCTPTPVNVNGNLYWIAYDTTEFKACGVLGFDIMAEKFKLMPLPLGNGHRYANSSLIDMGELLGFSMIDRESSPVNELGIDIWVVKDYENVGWSKMYSVRCSGGINRIDFRIGYSVDDIALCIREEEIVLLFVGPVSYLVQFDLKIKKYCIEQILDPDNLMWHYSLFYKESLISYDSFCNR